MHHQVKNKQFLHAAQTIITEKIINNKRIKILRLEKDEKNWY